jgi:hypothetical protein
VMDHWTASCCRFVMPSVRTLGVRAQFAGCVVGHRRGDARCGRLGVTSQILSERWEAESRLPSV